MKTHFFPLVFLGAPTGCAFVSDADHEERLSLLDEDGDQDGFLASEDCDDNDATAFPGNVEDCDNIDNDCDGEIDEASFRYRDRDGDGFGDSETGESVGCEESEGFVANAGDCNDMDPLAWTGAEEVCNDGSDNDCDGTANSCVFPSALTVAELDLEFEAGPLDREFGSQVTWVAPSSAEAVTGILISAPRGKLANSTGTATQGAVSYFAVNRDTLESGKVGEPTLRLVDGDPEEPDSEGNLGVGIWSGWGAYDSDDDSAPFSLISQPVSAQNLMGNAPSCRIYLLPSDALSGATESEIRSVSTRQSAVPCDTYASYGTVMTGLSSGFEEEAEFWSAVGVPGYAESVRYSDQGAVHLLNWGEDLFEEGGEDSGPLLVEYAPTKDALLGRSVATLSGSTNGDTLIIGRTDGFYWLGQEQLDGVLEDWTPGNALVVELPQDSNFVHSAGSDSTFGASLEALDIDGDGNDELAVGAPGEDDSVGHVFLFGPLLSGYSTQNAEQVLSGKEIDSEMEKKMRLLRFGAALSSGDLNGDGYSDLAVGAPETNYGRGGVLLFAGDGSGKLQEWVKLHGDSGAFGSSLDASGDWSQD
ncbi:MAG: MopE-related protein, partial [Myxococcota bacterium]|nr:MopE-related protein [Myxococcota bacterium]